MSNVQQSLTGEPIDRETALMELTAREGSHLADSKGEIDGLTTRSDFQADGDREKFCRVCRNRVTVGTEGDEYGHVRREFTGTVGDHGPRFAFEDGCPFKIEFSEGRW